MKRIKWLPAFLSLMIIAVLALGLGQLFLQSQSKKWDEENESLPLTRLNSWASELPQKGYGSLYEDTLKQFPSFDAKESYYAVLDKLFEQYGNDALHVEEIDSKEGRYAFLQEDNYLADLYYQDGIVSLPLTGNQTAIIEIPVEYSIADSYGLTVLEEHVPASNFYQFVNEEDIVYVNVVQMDGLLGEPDLSSIFGQEYGLVKDSISGHYLFGKVEEDISVLEDMIDYGERLALYPAQDIALGEITNVSLTSSSWYRKYITLQNYWFTKHSTYSFSNEAVIHCVAQSENTRVGEVVFDYFADNGEVSRTWHCGNQMTIIQKEGKWLIGGIEINNELNPNTIIPEPKD